jgi:hypothetical protein
VDIHLLSPSPSAIASGSGTSSFFLSSMPANAHFSPPIVKQFIAGLLAIITLFSIISHIIA